MSITVLLQKTRRSYVSRLRFSGRFLDEKFDFLIANFHFFLDFCQKRRFFKQFWELQFFMQRAMLLDSKSWHLNKDKCIKMIMKIFSDSHISRGGLLAPPPYLSVGLTARTWKGWCSPQIKFKHFWNWENIDSGRAIGYTSEKAYFHWEG